MKILKKSAAVALCALMAGSALSGCAQATIFGSYPQDLSWAYKDDTSTLPIGGYIYYNFSAFTSASQKVKNGTGDFLGQKLKDDDGKEVTALAYINQTTTDACKTYIYTNKLFKEKNLKLSADEVTAYKSNAESAWSYYKTSFEAMGISKDSLVTAGYENPAKLEAIFKNMYQKGGEKEVSDDELKKYYEDNYVNYSYYSVSLYDTTTDSDGKAKNTKKSDKDAKKIKDDLKSYADAINGGATYEDEVKAYMDAYKVESDPTITATNILENAGLGEEIQKALEGLKDGEATTITVGADGESPACYLIYRGNIKDESAKLKDNADTQYSVLTNMKGEEFQKYIKDNAKNVKYETNTDAIDKYPCTNFITEPATETATAAAASK